MSQSRRPPVVLFAWILLLDLLLGVSQKVASLAGHGEGREFYLSMLSSPYFWLCLILPVAQLLSWTRILSKVDLSLALPVTSLSYPLTMLCAGPLFGEHFSATGWSGAVAIMIGVWIIGSGDGGSERQPESERNPDLN